MLFDGGKPVRLGSRALEILITLAERAGEIVSKDELMTRVWPSTFVEEGNLRVHIAALRRTLGDGVDGARYLTNIPGRGYRFVADVIMSDAEPSEVADNSGFGTPHASLPVPARTIGREELVGVLAAQIKLQRLVTITGPGGIGKTTVALGVAGAAVADFERIEFLDVSQASDAPQVRGALAALMDLSLGPNDSIAGLVAKLENQHMLLVLDCCEHVADAVASLAEGLLRGTGGVHLLVTSREPLRIDGERVRLLASLPAPPRDAPLSAAMALTFPAVQLFVEHAAASDDSFTFTDADAPIVADICRRLDGIPLAVELAAGRVAAFGLSGVAALLDDRLRLLKGGRRTALPRHQTLAATLDWSYEVLPEVEQTLFRNLSVFAGPFELDAARAATEDIGSDYVDSLANLVTKSLVAVDIAGPTTRYRLLDTTRAYARDKLVQHQAQDRLSRRHALYLRDHLERAALEVDTRPRLEWRDRYVGFLGDLRQALDWAFSPAGDPQIAVTLTIAATPIWSALSLVEECLSRVEQALMLHQADPARDDRHEMRLSAVLATSLLYTQGADAKLDAAWSRTLEIAERVHDLDYQLRALWGLWLNGVNDHRYRFALSLAERFRAAASRSAGMVDPLVGDRMVGYTQHYLGDQPAAKRHIEAMLAGYVTPRQDGQTLRFQFDQRVLAGCNLALIQWLLGYPDQAIEIAERNVDHARSLDHAISLCTALAQAACPIALQNGDLEKADRLLASLLELAGKHDLNLWRTWGRCFRGILLIKRGDIPAGLSELESAVAQLPDRRFLPNAMMILCEMAHAQARCGRLREGQALITDLIRQSEQDEELWCLAELLRIKGELRLLGSPESDRAAEEAVLCFEQSLAWARRQQALAWELRAATSLARVWIGLGRDAEARELLGAVRSRFTEGFATADMVAASGLS